jgi:hypothetical protein
VRNDPKYWAYERGWGMSKEELLNAYVEGRISRRSFIRGLTAIGISQSSAVLHAAALRPGSTALADDLYDDGNHNKEQE